MAKKKEHLKQAIRNKELNILIGERNSKYPEWVITTVFYEAIHHIEAAFACIKKVYHTETCQRRGENMSYTRWRLIKKHFDRDVASSFDKLENASKSVRYLLSNYQTYYNKGIVTDFIDKDLSLIVKEAAKKYT